MQAYHFRNQEFGLRAIKERRLKISRIMELNDLFEFLGANLKDRIFRFAMNATKKQLSETKGLICFSQHWTNPVLWSHYADHHRGLCLGFEVADNILEKVRYVKERIRYPGTIDSEIMKKFLSTKFEHWSYEQEYRAFVDLDPEDVENDMHFMNFTENMKLNKVIVGHCSNVRRSEVNEALGDLRDKVETFKARAAFTKFEVVRNEKEEMWI